MAASCKCGCGQSNSGRLRKVQCPACGNIAYQSRTAISRGAIRCPCGASMVPPCVQDRIAMPGPEGDAAWAEMAGREAFSAVQSERGRKGAQIRKISRAVERGQKRRAMMLAGDIPF